MAATTPASGPVTYQDGTFLADVARVCGAAVANKINAHFAGCNVSVPRHPQPHHQLCQVLDVETVARISKEVGFGDMPALPMGGFGWPTKAMVVRLLLKETPVRKVAREAKCTTRYVYYVKAELRREGRL